MERIGLSPFFKFTLTLYKLFLTCTESMFEMVAFSAKMLDAGYLMLDIQECTHREIQKHPVSRINRYWQWLSLQRLRYSVIFLQLWGLCEIYPDILENFRRRYGMAIAVIGMLDEREEGLRLIKEIIKQRGHKVFLIDISIGTGAIESELQSEITSEEETPGSGRPEGSCKNEHR